MEDLPSRRPLDRHNALMASATTPKMLEQVYKQSLSDPAFYFFAEMRLNPLLEKADKKLTATVDLYCYGTYQDYMKNKSSFISLTDPQLNKLKLVSILRLCAFQKVLTYDKIQETVQVKSDTDVVNLLLDLMMGGYLRGRINEKERRVKVFDVVGLGLSQKDFDEFKADINAENKRIQRVKATLTNALDQIANTKYSDALTKMNIFMK